MCFALLPYFKRRRIAELEDVLERMENEHKQELNEAALQLQNKASEAANHRLDAERLRVRAVLASRITNIACSFVRLFARLRRTGFL